MSLGLPCRGRSRDFRLAEQICSHARAAVYRPLLVPDDHRVVQGGVLLGTQVLLQAVFIFLTAFATPAAPETTPAASTRNPHGPLNLPCENCHTTNAWMPIRSNPEFDHQKTGFPLRGMHTKVPCQECHIERVFAKVGNACQDCHTDIHRRKNGAQCDLCHRVTGWQVSIHNINEHQDRFPLIGAHAAVDCYSCHQGGGVGQFNRQGLSTDCVSCHLRAFQKTTAPNHQAFGFSMDCRQCHTSMDSWRIAPSFRRKLRR